MAYEEILIKIMLALDELYYRQQELIEEDVNEVTINSYFAIYLRKYFKFYSVDTEYNREYVPLLHTIGTKRTITPSGTEQNIKPDIIIHRRNHVDSNLVVIECKKRWNKDLKGREKDLQVLGGMTMNKEQAREIGYYGLIFSYPYGFYIDYGRTRREAIISIIKNGTTELQPIDFIRKTK